MSGWQVIEKENKHAVHAIVPSKQVGEDWIERYGDSKMFTDKTLTKRSFKVVRRKR